MALTQQQLEELYFRAVTMLQRKLLKIQPRVFPFGQKPTMSDVLSNNEAAFHLPNIPNQYQLPFIFDNYERFVKAQFRVNKKSGDMDINEAIFYWQMDGTHSFSRYHKQVSHNIIVACIIRVIPNWADFVTPEAHQFCSALVDAWMEAATHQGGFERQEAFLELWATGPYDLMYFGHRPEERMREAVKELGQYVPHKAFRLGGEQPFLEQLERQYPKHVEMFGPAWAIRWIVETEVESRRVGEKVKGEAAQDALDDGSFMAGFGGMGLEQGYVSEELFAQPLVQSLLREYDEDMEEQADRVRDKKDMWMDPAAALKMLECTSELYETMKHIFRKLE